MIGVDDFIIGFAASYVAGNIPTISGLLNKHKALEGRIEGCYSIAIKNWCPNSQIREKEYSHYSSLENFIEYLRGEPATNQGDISKLFELWADEMRKDSICYNAILEIKEDVINSKLDEYFADLRTLILETRSNSYQSFKDASISLRNVWPFVGKSHHIERKETDTLYDWLNQEVDVLKGENVALLLGGPGQGKSVIMHDLLSRLEKDGKAVLGLKSDLLFDASDTDINKKLRVGISVQTAIKNEARDKQVVLIIDQIDALSSTLSSDRRPLSVLNSLILDVSSHPNVRVIISCRPYDLEYDSSLERYKRCKNVIVKPLSDKEVADALATEGLSIYNCPKQLIDLLRIPQNLFLFTRLKHRQFSAISQNSLYDVLWKEVVNDCSNVDTSSERLVSYLSLLSQKLYERQALAINAQALGSTWVKEQSYLITNGILTEDAGYGNIQFIHQTLFDYVYARLFFESGQSLQSSFENAHQGLFVRPRLKQVLDYQRSVDPEKYIENLKRVLFGKNESGLYHYRYQLRHLVLTNLAYQQSLLDGEKSLISKKILNESDYESLYLNSAVSKDAFDIVRTEIDRKGGFFEVRDDLKFGILELASKVCAENHTVLKYLSSICAPELDPGSRQRLARIVDFTPFGSLPAELDIISDYLEADADDIVTSNYYERLCTSRPDRVIDRFGTLVSHIMSKNDKSNLYGFNLPLNASCVYSHFKQSNPERFHDLCMKLIDVLSSDRLEIDEDIQTSHLFYLYNRHNMRLHFSDEVLGDLFEYLESTKCLNDEKSKIILDSFNKPVDVYHMIGIVGCMSDINYYKDVSYDYLRANINKTHSSSPLYYYQKELFGKVFMLLDLKQQTELMDVVSKLSPSWESVSLKGTPFEGNPISRIGYTRAQYYNLIPTDYLNDNFHEEKMFLDQMLRKYKSIVNTEPNAIHSMVGWSTMETSAYENMKNEDILGSMEKYNSDSNPDWNVPSKTGHAMALRSFAEKSPEKYYNIYKKALQSASIDKVYIIEGIEGLMTGGLEDEKVNELLESLISKLDLNDINNNDPSILIQITRRASYYIENKKDIPEFFFNFIRNVALHSEDDIDKGRRYDVNDGINRVRGCACDYLVQCGTNPNYSDAVFEALETIGVGASSATRCAALFQIGILLHVDRKRTFDVIKRMTADFNPDVLSLPLHRLNPLLYINAEEFKDFLPYFKACIDYPDTHKVNTTLLLRAYLAGKDGSEELLLKMADSSEESRSTLIGDIKDYYRVQYHDKCLTLLLRYIDKDEPNLGRCYDEIFTILGKWNKDVIDFVDKLTVSPVCKYCNNKVYDFVDQETANYPENCLRWLTNLYGIKKDFTDFNLSVDRIITALVSAYNSIRKFDKENPVLEKAMDLLDDVLSRDYLKWETVDCLRKLNS